MTEASSLPPVSPATGAQITVSIVSYNTREMLRECLRSLELWREELELQIIVADNASGDGSLAMAQREFPQVEAFGTGGNLGFGRAHNLAFERATAPFFLILNSDAILGGADLVILRDFLRDHPGAGAVTPQLFYPDGSRQISHGDDPVLSNVFWQQSFLDVVRGRLSTLRPSPDAALIANAAQNAAQEDAEAGADAIEVEQVPGACVLLRSEAFRAVGGFDARFWMYVEDVDLNLRLRRAGWKIHLLPCARAGHHLGGSSGNWRSRARMVAAFNRSQMIFFGTHRGARAARAVKIATLLGALLRLALWTPAALFRPPARDKIRIFRQVLRATWRVEI